MWIRKCEAPKELIRGYGELSDVLKLDLFNAILNPSDGVNISKSYQEKRDDRLVRRQTNADGKKKSKWLSLSGGAASIGILMLVISIAGVFSKGVNVEWKLKKQPVFFGKDLQLQCQIYDKENLCQKDHREWLGGQNYDLLCKDGVCRNKRKYKETVDGICLYTLVVYNLTEEDIGCPYTCAYGIFNHKSYLMLEEDTFVYDPMIKEDSIQKNISLENGDINIFIKIEKVYPAPECVILFEHENISKAEDMNTTMRSDGFFTTEVKVASRLSTCKGVIEMICRIGKENRRIVYVVVDYCKGDEKVFDLWVWITLSLLLIGAAIGLIGMCLMLLKGYQRSSNKEKHQEPLEMAPMMKC